MPAVGQEMYCHPRNATFLDAGCRNGISGRPLTTALFTSPMSDARSPVEGRRVGEGLLDREQEKLGLTNTEV